MKTFIILVSCLPITVFGQLSYLQQNKNAVVPSTAIIRPAQAFVDTIAGLTDPNAAVNLSNKGITHIDATWLVDRLNRCSASASCNTAFNFSGGALSTSEVNAILAAFISFGEYLDGGTINLSGGTNAAPSGQGITDKSTLEGLGWTVNTN